MKRRINKTKAVLEHLQKYGSITSWEAIDKYGATRLSAIIFNLKSRYNIHSVLVDDEGGYRYARYFYHGEIHNTYIKEDKPIV